MPADNNQYLPGATVTVLGKGNLARTGYTFICWNTQADGNGTDRAPAVTFAMGTTSVILYAKWTADPTYTVSYDANGGSGSLPADNNKYLSGAAVTVLNKGSLARSRLYVYLLEYAGGWKRNGQSACVNIYDGYLQCDPLCKVDGKFDTHRDIQFKWRNRECAYRQQSISAGSDGYCSGQGQPCKNRLYIYLLEHAGRWKRNEQNACVDIYNGYSQCDPLCKVDGEYH